MKTYILEGVVTALSSITHNGGERNGVVTQLRREKFVQENGKVIEIPVISGNSVRGKFRDISAIDILTNDEGEKTRVDQNSFNLLFSGGSLESTGAQGIDIEKIRKLRKEIPMLSVLGGAVGNIILPGKVDIGKLIPVAKETKHLIPGKFWGDGELKSIWEYCQVEMYTRKDDSKDENYREFLKEDEKKSSNPVQMMYNIETIAAGTRFYWKICLRDPSDLETGAFLSIFNSWCSQASQLGGNGRIGHGAVKVELLNSEVVEYSKLKEINDEFVTYIDLYKDQKKDAAGFFENDVVKTVTSEEGK